MEPKTTGKRIVSKGAYIANLGNKGVGSSIGAGLLVLSLLCTLVAGIALWAVVTSLRSDPFNTICVAFFVALLTYGAIYVYRLGTRAIREAKQIDLGVPLTRANSRDLPAPDSLVRASEESRQAQEAVLLRAAEGQERHDEQLLRAAAGKQE